MNEAHEVLHGILFDVSSQVYVKEELLDITANTEAVTIPTDSFMGVNVLSVDYKNGSGSGDYVKLKKVSEHQRDSSSSGAPSTYVQRENQILLGPIPSTSKTSGLRVVYEYQLPTVDVRRGKVSAVDSGSAPTSITITDNTLGNIAFADSDLSGMYITVVDKDGNQQMKNIPVASYSSGVLTLGSFTPTAGELVAVNDYVVVGANSSTHSPFPRSCEPFLLEYTKRNVYELRGHPMLGASDQKLQSLEAQVTSMVVEWSSDIKYIPEIDTDRIIY